MRIALFDIAGTLVDGNPWFGLLKHPSVNRFRIYRMYPALIGLYVAKKLKLISDIRFRQLWVQLMASLLRGLSQKDTDVIFDWIARDYVRSKYRQDVVVHLKQHVADGDTVILVSGMFTPMTNAIAKYLDAHVGLGTHLVFEGDVCTGEISGPVCAGDVKVDFVHEYLEREELAFEQIDSIAYTDSESDIPMLTYAKAGVATHPDADLRNAAIKAGWRIIG